MKVCAENGCPTLTPESRCEQHRKQRARESRKRYPKGSYGPEWPRISKRYLKAHPVCECRDVECKCGGQCGARSAETDHIVPLRMFTTLRAAHHDSNLQALCKPCHARKTAYEVGFAGPHTND